MIIEAVPEMKPIAEMDFWAKGEPKAPTAEIAPALAAWDRARPAVAARLTPELVRSLSHWARDQMAGYRQVPTLDHVRFQVAGQSEDAREILLESTIDTLPSHSPLVTRWLKLYLVCDKSTGRINRAIITIRGQALE